MPKSFKKVIPKTHSVVSSRHRLLFGIMLGAAVAALLAAFTLTLDKLIILQNPNAQLSCSINIVLNCSHVMQTWQSDLFGFPNMLIGLMAFPVVITLAVAGLSGVKFPRPFLIAAEICILLGTFFSYWLFFQSLYAIQVLCPWCLVVTTMTTLMGATITQYNLYENTFQFSKGESIRKWLSKGYLTVIVIGWLVLLTALVFLKFGSALFA